MVQQPGNKHKHHQKGTEVKTLPRHYLFSIKLFLCAVAGSGLNLRLSVLVDGLY